MELKVTQAKGYTGKPSKKYFKDLEKMVKQYMKLGKSEQVAREHAESIMVMYAHHHDYREVIE